MAKKAGLKTGTLTGNNQIGANPLGTQQFEKSHVFWLNVPVQVRPCQWVHGGVVSTRIFPWAMTV